MSSPERNIDDLLLDPKFTDWVAQPNGELKIYWDTWVKNQPDRAEDLEVAKSFLQGISFSENTFADVEKEKMLEAISQGLNEKNLNPKINTRRRAWIGIAASIALLIGAFLFVDWDNGNYSVPYGEIQEIELPDGSEVILNANSTLRYESGWEKETIREVWLDGEALFQVSPNPKKGARQFIVHTNRGDIKVLGTTFNVKNRAEHFSVLLTEGSVILSLTEQAALEPREIEMTPGDMIDLDVKNKTLHSSKPNTNVYTSWTQRKLVCDNTSIAYLASVIEDQYGYEVIIQDQALADRKLTGTLNNPGLEDLIEAISLSFNIQVEKTGERKLTISY